MMFFRSTSLLAAAAALLLAQTSLSAVVRRFSQDEAIDSIEARSNAEVFSNSTEVGVLEDRRGGGGAGDIISGIVDIITGIQDGINRDKDARSKFTYDLIGKLHAQHPNFNWIMCHTKHTTKFDGKRGVDWDHRHQEFDVKIGGTIGYEIYNLKSGEFTRQGDGGYLNWAYIGNIAKTDQNGKHLVFAKP